MVYRENKQSQRIIQFYNHLDRSQFIDNENRDLAHYDRALSIGFGQTISQPSLVLEMTIQLDLNKECKVLEIGTGSGYQTVFLAEFADKVFTIDRIAELSDKAREKLKKLGYDNIFFKIGDGSRGWQEFSPYDRIITTAAAARVPDLLLDQLKPGGKMIAPVGERTCQELFLIQKDEFSQIEQKSLGQVRFVEFKGEYGWK